MSFGLDFVSGPSIDAMKTHDPPVTFVCRYLSVDNPLTRLKMLTPGEATLLSEAGIAIVSNFEWYANRALSGDFGGVQDARTASAQHTACGGPPDRPIYFSVDFDGDGTQVADYFRGIASVIGLARTGAYGSERVITYLLDNHLIEWAWQTYAWSRGAWEPRAHIQQYENGVEVDGHSVDYNRSMKPDFGQWFTGGTTHMPIPTGWHDDGTTLTAPNGHFLQHGFRALVLAAPSWDSGNQPNEEEYHASPAQLHRPDLGDGQRVTLRDDLLWFTPAQGVVQEHFLGLELKACYDLIAAQQAEIAALKAVPPPAPAPAPLNPDVAVELQAAIGDIQKAESELKGS